MKALTQTQQSATPLRSIPSCPKYLILNIGTEAYHFADIINSCTCQYFVCSFRTSERCSTYKVRLYQEPYGKLLYWWLYFRFVFLNGLGDMLFSDWKWYRKHIGGLWSYIQLGDEELYARMWVRGRAIYDEVLKKESYKIKL